MKRINKKLVEALDKLIAKYSGERVVVNDKLMNCPLCDLFYYSPFSEEYSECCKRCPNMFFSAQGKEDNTIGCDDRNREYPNLSYLEKENYPTLKQFWTDYKSLYLQRIYTNSEIMEILIKPFKQQL